jgi:cell division protein FtsB
MDLNRVKAKRNIIIQKNDVFVKENISLYKKIDRLKQDTTYIEFVARQELGMIKKEEVIFKFNRPHEDGLMK